MCDCLVVIMRDTLDESREQSIKKAAAAAAAAQARPSTFFMAQALAKSSLESESSCNEAIFTGDFKAAITNKRRIVDVWAYSLGFVVS